VSQADPQLSLGALGTGSAGDRLPFRTLVALLVRCARLLRPVKRHLLALFAGFGALAVVFVPVGLLLMDAFWTRALEGQPLTAWQARFLALDTAAFAEVPELGAPERRAVLRRVVVLGVIFGLVVTPLLFALYYYQVWILQRVNQLLRLRLVDRLQSLSLRFHAESRVGDAIYRMYQDSAMVTQLVEVLVLVPLSTLTRFLFGLVVVACFDPRLALLLAVIWIPLLVLGHFFSRRLRVGFRRAREANAALTSRIQETLAGIRVIKAYGAEAFEQRRFEEASLDAFDAAFRARGRLAVFLIALFWVTASALVLGGAFAAWRTLEGGPVAVAAFGFTVWTLGLFNYCKTRFGDGADNMRLLFRTWGRTQDIAIGLDRVFELLDLEPEVRDAPDAVPLQGVREGIRYRDVAFRYQPDRASLEGVDFEARVGEVTAIVGPTGSGKTTLMALLLRLFDPQRGSIEIDGVDLRRFQVASLRAKVAVALQENLLFGTTVRENIRYAVPEASDEAVREAARVACADEFIERLSDAYDTLLGERGTKLSTGQRQRLSIARAVLKETPILILDEPTASLDAETELRVLRNLATWGRGRLIFLVTHRLSTIRRADRILVLRDGRVSESGSHGELLARPGGTYRSLVEHENDAAEEALAGAGA
jgi:ABC-type multidrug transport system fused ATPase/permease subunit